MPDKFYSNEIAANLLASKSKSAIISKHNAWNCIRVSEQSIVQLSSLVVSSWSRLVADSLVRFEFYWTT